MNTDKSLVEALSKSRIYQDYEQAFINATGLPLRLRPVETWQLPLHGKPGENRFCRLMAEQSRTCAVCLEVGAQLTQKAANGPDTVTCPVGLCDMAVPVRLGDHVIGFLQTGQVFLKRPTEAVFAQCLKRLEEWGVKADVNALRDAWFGSRLLKETEHRAILQLLDIFAQHLSMVSNQILVQKEKAEPAVIAKAKHYIQEHLNESISLQQVAQAVHTSTFYFCKLFKKVTELNFTDYVSRLRIEKAKALLLNPNLRISEIAYEVGFQSLTHFNRVFKRILGRSPTEYRLRLQSQ